MKNVKVISVAVAAIVVGISAAASAHAQTSCQDVNQGSCDHSGEVSQRNAFSQTEYSNKIESHQDKSRQTPVGSSSDYDNRPGVVIRGGYNVGRTSVRDVPGCVGPASFCNMYFGN